MVGVVPLIAEDRLDPIFATYVDQRRSAGARIPNNVLTLANAPELGIAARGIFDAAQTVGSIPRTLRYLLRYVVSNSNACRYCTTHQVNWLVHEFGLSPEHLKAALDPGPSDLFSDAEKAALLFARALTFDASNVPEAVYEQMKKHFSAAETVEVTIIVAAMNMINIVNDGLKIPLEEEAIRRFQQVALPATEGDEPLKKQA